MQEKPVLKAEKLEKKFYTGEVISILKGVDLTVFRGDTVAIMGRSGEGKSTLLHILGTLENACAGSLKIADCDVNALNKAHIRNQHIGFVFQAFHLLEDYTVLENILMPAKIARNPTKKGSEAYQKAEYLLEKVGLSHRSTFYTKLLSGGEKQRVAIARALCNNPSIIFADEPSGNLDRKTSEAIHEMLLGFVEENQKSLVVVTHNKDLALLCKKSYRLEDGKLEIS